MTDVDLIAHPDCVGGGMTYVLVHVFSTPEEDQDPVPSISCNSRLADDATLGAKLGLID